MPIDQGVETDLKFLLVEVRKQSQASYATLKKSSTSRIEAIKKRDDYVDGLRDVIESKSHFHIHHLYGQDPRSVNHFKALITIATNLERIADHYVNISDQTGYLTNVDNRPLFNFKKSYALINKTLNWVFPAFVNTDEKIARKICKTEKKLDKLYMEDFEIIQQHLRDQSDVDNMVTYLFITRYLERIGDAFKNIGEAIINVHTGVNMSYDQVNELKSGLEAHGINIDSNSFEYRPILNTRSGCQVARIVEKHKGKSSRKFFYKEGHKDKIMSEIDGINLWEQNYPGYVPKMLWQGSKGAHASVMMELIDGRDLLDIVIKPHKSENHLQALYMLTDHLKNVWNTTRVAKKAPLTFTNQILKRLDDINIVHENLIEENLDKDFDSLIKSARKIEKKLTSPHLVLSHGDFNVDNILFDFNAPKVYFVDVHRSQYNDYIQDLSVFLVSSYRVPVYSNFIRQRLNDISNKVFEFAQNYAQEVDDITFDARLALGLFRSFLTSTRFQFDTKFSAQMFKKGYAIISDLNEYKKNLEDFKIKKKHFLHEGLSK